MTTPQPVEALRCCFTCGSLFPREALKSLKGSLYCADCYPGGAT